MNRKQKIGVLSALVVLAMGSFGVSQMAQATDYTAGKTITIVTDSGSGTNTIDVKYMAVGESIDLGEATAAGNNALAFGIASKANGNYATALGVNSAATGVEATSIGVFNTAEGKKAVAMGHENQALANNAVAMGKDNVAKGVSSTAVGVNNDVGTEGDGKQSTAVGYYNTVYGTQSSGVGYWNYIEGNYSSAFGSKNVISADNSSAMGLYNNVSGDSTYVFGANNTITAKNALVLGTSVTGTIGDGAIVLGKNITGSVAANSVVIGDGSTSEEENTVSVGTTGNERKIVHVKDGEDKTDAATFGQVAKKDTYEVKDGKVEVKTNAGGTAFTITGIGTGADVGDTSKLADAGLGDNVVDSVLSVNDKVGSLSNDINKVGAGAAALAALHPEGFDPADKWSFAVGYGHYKNANAGALGAFYKPNFDTTLSIGGTIGNGSSMMNAGVSFKLGQRGARLSQNASNSQLVQEVNALRAENAQQAQEIRELKAQMAKVLAKVGG